MAIGQELASLVRPCPVRCPNLTTYGSSSKKAQIRKNWLVWALRGRLGKIQKVLSHIDLIMPTYGGMWVVMEGVAWHRHS